MLSMISPMANSPCPSAVVRSLGVLPLGLLPLGVLPFPVLPLGTSGFGELPLTALSVGVPCAVLRESVPLAEAAGDAAPFIGAFCAASVV